MANTVHLPHIATGKMPIAVINDIKPHMTNIDQKMTESIQQMKTPWPRGPVVGGTKIFTLR
jgi:hypothetical protein